MCQLRAGAGAGGGQDSSAGNTSQVQSQSGLFPGNCWCWLCLAAAFRAKLVELMDSSALGIFLGFLRPWIAGLSSC